jgi:hypothetical protein
MIPEPDMNRKDAKLPRRKALLSVKTLARCGDFGLRWQSAAATPLFDCGQSRQSGVALRFPPQSKKIYFASPRLCAFALKN